MAFSRYVAGLAISAAFFATSKCSLGAELKALVLDPTAAQSAPTGYAEIPSPTWTYQDFNNLPVPTEVCTPTWSCTAGAEATFLMPHFDGSGFVRELSGRNFVNVNNEFVAAPRLYLGLEHECGGGIRGRYWQMQGSDNFAGFLTGAPPLFDAVAAFQEFEVNAVDLEYTRRFQTYDWNFLGSLGVRNASLSRIERFTYNADDFLAFSSANFQYHGTGLTSCLEARRPIGNNGLSLFASLRGSALWGSSRQQGSTLIDTNLVDRVGLARIDQESVFAGIWETQVGLEWAHNLQAYKGRAFARIMFEYQRWTVDSREFSMIDTVNGTTLRLDNLYPDVDLYGITFAVGFSR